MAKEPASPPVGAPPRPPSLRLTPAATSAFGAEGLARALLEQSPFSTVVYDAEGRLLAANAAFDALWGVSIEDAPPDYNVLTDPELERQGVLAAIRRAFAGERVVTSPVRYDISRISATRAGRAVWTQGHFFPLRDAAGRVTHVVLTHIDLTARMEAEEALRQRTREYEEQVEEAQALNEELEQTNEELARARDDAERERARLRLVLDSLPDGTRIYDAEWRYVYLNPAAARAVVALGRDPAALRGRVAWEEFPELVGTAAHAAALRAVRERRVVEYEDYSPALGRWLETRVVPMPDGAIAISRDVTARRRAQVASRLLADAGALLAASLDEAAAVREIARLAVPAFADWCAVDVLDDSGELARLAVAHADPEKVRWAEALRRRYPPAPDAAAGPARVARTGYTEFYPEVTEETLAAATRDAEHLRLVRAVGFRSAIVAPLAARRRTLGALTLVTAAGPDGTGRRFGREDVATAEELARRAALAIDNARLYRAERQAAERTARLQAVTARLACQLDADETADAILGEGAAALGADRGVVCVLTEDGTALEIVRQVGIREEIERAFHRYPVDAPLPLSEAVRTGQALLFEDKRAVMARYPAIAAATASSRAEAWIAVPLRVDGATLGGLAFGFDAPRRFGDADRAFVEALAGQCAQALERARLYAEAQRARAQAERARAEAEAANEAKSRFLATMSHELRTPLNAIDGYAELLEMGLRGPLTPAQLEDVGRIRRSQKHLLALVDDVLGFARLESGRLELDVAPVPLDELLAGLEELVAPQLRTRGGALAYEYRRAAPEVRVLADRERLRQVLLNLLSNAVKFTDAGRVTLACAVRERDVAISVTDTGRGIPPDMLDAVFEPFVQVERGLTRSTPGSGLGLAISRDLARRMGGDITVTSAPGAGSTFTLTVPRAP